MSRNVFQKLFFFAFFSILILQIVSGDNLPGNEYVEKKGFQVGPAIESVIPILHTSNLIFPEAVIQISIDNSLPVNKTGGFTVSAGWYLTKDGKKEGGDHVIQDLVMSIQFNKTAFMYLKTCEFKDIPINQANVTWFVKLTPYQLNVTFTCSVSMWFYQQKGILSPDQLAANDAWNGVRSFYYDFTQEGIAHSLNFLARSQLSMSPDVFKKVSVSFGTCNAAPKYSIDGNTKCIRDDGTPSPCMADLNDQLIGLYIKDLLPGRWWFNFEFNNPSPFPAVLSQNWGFEVKPTTTCNVNCFTHGECVEVPAYCKCNTFWDGEDCTLIFRGVFVVASWAAIFAVAIIFFVGRTIWSAAKEGKFDGVKLKINGRGRKNSLNTDSEEEIAVPTEEDSHVNSEKAPLIRRSTNTKDDERENF